MENERDITLDCQALRYQNNGIHTQKETYSNKFYNLKEMHKWLEKHNIPKLTQYEIENPHKRIVQKRKELFIKHFPTKNTASTNDCTGKFIPNIYRRNHLINIFRK